MPEPISTAITLALTAHDGQMYGQQPYILHPLEVGVRLLNAGATKNQVVIGLLHDVLEDSAIRYEEILAAFGPEVAEPLVMVTHASPHRVPYEAYVRALEGDAAIAKVFDSACNLLHLHELPPERQPKKRDRYRRNVAHHHQVVADAGLVPDIQVAGIISESLVAYPNGWD